MFSAPEWQQIPAAGLQSLVDSNPAGRGGPRLVYMDIIYERQYSYAHEVKMDVVVGKKHCLQPIWARHLRHRTKGRARGGRRQAGVKKWCFTVLQKHQMWRQKTRDAAPSLSKQASLHGSGEQNAAVDCSEQHVDWIGSLVRLSPMENDSPLHKWHTAWSRG